MSTRNLISEIKRVRAIRSGRSRSPGAGPGGSTSRAADAPDVIHLGDNTKPKPSPEPTPEPQPSADERPPIFRWPQDEEPPATPNSSKRATHSSLFDLKNFAIAALVLVVLILGGTVIELTNPKLILGAPNRVIAYVDSIITPKACTFGAQTVAHRASVVAYRSPTVPPGGSCSAEPRECRDGVLSGSYQYSSCSALPPPPPPPPPPRNCELAGRTVSHNGSIIAYESASVLSGGFCRAETRLCSDGRLTGTYIHTSCTVLPPEKLQDCWLDGQRVEHGTGALAYASSSPPPGTACSSEWRRCSNGSMSGTFAHRSCTPRALQSCTFNGRTVQHGETVTAYHRDTVLFPDSCVPQKRFCVNGTLDGSYQAANCHVMKPEKPPSLTFVFTNETGLTLAVSFKSDATGRRWPSATDKVYVLRPGATQGYPLQCQAGERICYGARPHSPHSTLHWGANVDHSAFCSDCCATCDVGAMVETRLTRGR